MNSASHEQGCSGRRRAILRLVLGQCQVIGATATLVILLQRGLVTPVLWLAAITGVVTLTSLVLFRLLWPEKRNGS